MPESMLDAAEKAYNREGFETLRKGDGALLVAKDAPVVVIIGRKKRLRAVDEATPPP